MIVIENGDLIEGDATTASEVDFVISGLDNNALVQFADGQLANSKGTLYTANSTDVVSSIILVNTGAAHNHVNLYSKSSGGTSRRLIPKDMQLESGYSLHFEGGKVHVLDAVGGIIYGQNVSDVAYAASWDGVTTVAPSKNAVYDSLMAKTGANLAIGSDANGDMYYRASSVLARLAKGTAAQALVMNGTATAPEWGTIASGYPLGFLSGLALSNAADTDHDILIAVGECRDSTDAADITLASALTKRADAAWAVGSTEGGMDTGSIPASATLHVWLIKRSDTGVVDALFSISATAPTMPASYDYKRLIGSYRTDSSNNIINGDWWGTGLYRTFMFDTPILDYTSENPGTSAVTAALSVPGGIIVNAIFNTAGTGISTAYVSGLANTDLAASADAVPLSTVGSGTNQPQGHLDKIFTNTSSQIRFRRVADSPFRIATLGWEQSL